MELIDNLPPEGIENLDVVRSHLLDVRVENTAMLRSLTLERNNVVHQQLKSGSPALILTSEEAKIYKDASSTRNDAKKAWKEVSRLTKLNEEKGRENRELSIKVSNLNHTIVTLREESQNKDTQTGDLRRQLQDQQNQSAEITKLLGEQEISKLK